MAITREQVFQAGDEIFSQGKTPRIEGVRTLLGSGSYSTIGKYLKEWKEQNPESANVSTTEIPQDLHNAAYEALKPVIALIWDKASESVDSERLKTLELENERYQQQTSELAGLRAAYQALMARNEQLSQDLALARAGVGSESVNGYLQLQSDFDLLELERDELSRQCESLTKDLNDSLSSNAILQSRLDALKNERKTLAEQCHRLKLENAEIDTLRDRVKEKDASIANLQKKLPKRGVAPLEVDTPSSSQLNQQLSAALAEIEHLRTKLGEKERLEYLESLEIEDGASARDSERVEPTHWWGVGDTFKTRAELKSEFLLSERESRKDEIPVCDGSVWRRLSESQSAEIAKRLSEHPKTVFYKCVKEADD